MSTKIAINGFGRIGRLVLRAARAQGLSIMAVNDLADARTLTHLLKYDSVHGPFPGDVALEGNEIVLDGESRIQVCSERDPSNLPWRSLGVDIAIEATGRFRDREEAAQHLRAGAGHVIVTAPSPDADVTVVLGVNDGELDPVRHRVVSNASCTTNCLAPVAKVLDDHFGIVRGWMTTIHAYTNDQPILDTAHKDLRRARAGALSMIPTSTGAARALGLVLPQLKGKLDGYAMRVPTPDVSAVDLSLELGAETDAGAINDALRQAAAGPMSGVLAVCDDPCVSIDFQGDPHSSIVDAAQTQVMGGNFAKLLAWYDNEWGYTCRVVDLANRIAAASE
ncbi:MAG: type I glyceraldehyde-3-phosphate dehydrogenase [Deltaproteobacteria bacterium]|nr:type I glyceraldehyde-3-phosphate dehydrogenase [Deltaproteobacteria bacterium]MBW2446025.1 type I glyceraldehyde-3-phosphate dehydrogenase [Deltaproteobacteria bacterium]